MRWLRVMPASRAGLKTRLLPLLLVRELLRELRVLTSVTPSPAQMTRSTEAVQVLPALLVMLRFDPGRIT